MASFTVRSVSIGISTMGRSEVAESGIASDIHQIAISVPMAATLRASGDSPSEPPSNSQTSPAAISPAARIPQTMPADRLGPSSYSSYCPC